MSKKQVMMAVMLLITLTACVFPQVLGEVETKATALMGDVFGIITKIAAGLIIIMAAYKTFQAVTGNAPPSTWYTIIFMLIGAVAIVNAPKIFTAATGINAPWTTTP